MGWDQEDPRSAAAHRAGACSKLPAGSHGWHGNCLFSFLGDRSKSHIPSAHYWSAPAHGRIFRKKGRGMNPSISGRSLERTRQLQERAHRVIPGGAHTYAKGDDQYPAVAPGFLARGEGCHVWDPDGNAYIEYGMGLRSVTLGHAHPDVVAAAYAAMRHGCNFTRPAPLELECADELLQIIPRADMVKFAKNGSDTTTAAVKLARAYTGRSMVAMCADHPFFSVDDWFIGTTAMDAGIPDDATALTAQFRYNDLESLRTLFRTHSGKIACVILEPVKNDEPEGDFLHAVRSLCSEQGALLIFDEMITGFRVHLGGGQALYDVSPDLSTFGKGMANGFALAALAGKREVMELGGLDHSSERVFLLSTTHGAETTSLAAAIATMRIFKTEPVIETLRRQGVRLTEGVRQAIDAAGVEGHFRLMGRPCNLVFQTLDQDRKPSQAFRTLFMQELVRSGVIAPSFVVSYAHGDEDIDRTIEVVHEALQVYARALSGGVDGLLIGPSVKPVFRRFN